VTRIRLRTIPPRYPWHTSADEAARMRSILGHQPRKEPSVNESTLQSLLDRAEPVMESVNLLEWAIGYIQETGFIPSEYRNGSVSGDYRRFQEAKQYLARVRGE
jgi:hypothetical protein